jgi:hypothetical protein
LGRGVGELAGRFGELIVELLIHGGLLRLGMPAGNAGVVRCNITPFLLRCNIIRRAATCLFIFLRNQRLAGIGVSVVCR